MDNGYQPLIAPISPSSHPELSLAASQDRLIQNTRVASQDRLVQNTRVGISREKTAASPQRLSFKKDADKADWLRQRTEGHAIRSASRDALGEKEIAQRCMSAEHHALGDYYLNRKERRHTALFMRGMTSPNRERKDAPTWHGRSFRVLNYRA